MVDFDYNTQAHSTNIELLKRINTDYSFIRLTSYFITNNTQNRFSAIDLSFSSHKIVPLYERPPPPPTSSCPGAPHFSFLSAPIYHN